MKILDPARTEQRQGWTLVYSGEECLVTHDGIEWIEVTPDDCSCSKFKRSGTCEHLKLAYPKLATVSHPAPVRQPRTRGQERPVALPYVLPAVSTSGLPVQRPLRAVARSEPHWCWRLIAWILRGTAWCLNGLANLMDPRI